MRTVRIERNGELIGWLGVFITGAAMFMPVKGAEVFYASEQLALEALV